MSAAAAQQVKPKSQATGPEVRRAGGTGGPTAQGGAPRYLRPDLRVGGVHDREEHEAEQAAVVVAAGGRYRLHDPGGSQSLRAAVAATVLDPGADGRIKRTAGPAPVQDGSATLRRAAHCAACEAAQTAQLDGSNTLHRTVVPPVLDPGADGRIRRLAAPADSAPAQPMQAATGGETLHRAPAANAPGDPAAARRIDAARAAVAQPLSPGIRARLEDGFGQSMAGVQVHTGSEAHAAAASIGARAYTQGNRITLGRGESEHDLRLIAHEATHVVQNRTAAVTAPVGRRAPEPEEPGRAAAPELRRTESPDVRPVTDEAAHHAAVGPPGSVRRNVPVDPAAQARSATDQDIHRIAEPEGVAGSLHASPAAETPIRRFDFGLGSARDWVADKANAIPGFRMFTIILGMNPITMQQVDHSPANILRAVVELMPGGLLITQALDKYGVFEKAGAWVSQQINSLAMTGEAIIDAVSRFIHSLSITDVASPGDVWDRGKRIFTEPIDQIGKFIVGLVDGVVQFVKDAVLHPLAELASKTRAWDLLIALLGKNPITGEDVPQTAETLIGGFLKLIGQQEIFENLQKADGVKRALAWFNSTKTTLIGFVQQIPTLFKNALKSFQASDLLDLPGAIGRVLGMFGDFAEHFVDWAGKAMWSLLEIIFDVVSPGAWAYVKKTGAALRSILQNPLPFVGNLVKAAKLGLQNFADNIGTHLKRGLIEWLTGAVPGVYIPQAFSLVEIGKFVLSILGVTWAQIRGKIVKALGPTSETIMKALETTFDVVVALVRGGPAAAWELIKEKLTNLKDMVIDGITGFVTDTIIQKAIPKLVAMFIPGAGFISAIVSIYGTVKAFIERLAQIAAAIKAFIDSIVAIAEGQIEGAAKKVEMALAGALSIAISLLAGFLGLGNIAEKVRGVIEKVRAAVDKALDTAIAWIVGKAKALFARLFGGGEKDKKKPGDKDLGAAKNAARDTLRARLSGGETLQEAQKTVAAVAGELKPIGVISIEIGPKDEADNWPIIVEATPRQRVLELTGRSATVAVSATIEMKSGDPLEGIQRPAYKPVVTRIGRGGAVEMGDPGEKPLEFRTVDKLKRQKPTGQTEDVANLPAVTGVSTKLNKVPHKDDFQPSAGYIIRPPPGQTTLEVVSWNTREPSRGSNASHAERQFENWFVDRPPAWLRRVKRVTVVVQGRPICADCDRGLRHLQAELKDKSATAHIVFEYSGPDPKDDDEKLTPK